MSYPILRSKLRPVVRATVALRISGVALMLSLFFVIGAPIQWLILRLDAGGSNVLPRLFYRLLLRLVKVRVNVRGAPDAVPQLIVANHISWADIPALGSVLPISFLAKREIARWPVVGTFARLQKTIFVDRGNRQSVVDANAVIAARLRRGDSIAIFPEGTTYDGTQLGPFRSAHFGAAQDLLALGLKSLRIDPVAIRYSSPHAAWCGDALLLPHVIGVISGAPVTCDLIFCAPLEFAANADRKQIAEECRRRIAAALAEAQSGSAIRMP
jgi:1-acyl-sn-glycerol-3-phosphate acyltransferase